MKVGFLTMEKCGNRAINSVGSSRIRARWLWEIWPEAEEWQMGRKYDVVIFQKAYMTGSDAWRSFMENFDGIKIFDACDPDWLERDAQFFEGIDYMDAVVTSTQALADYIKKMRPQKKVVYIADRLDLKQHTGAKQKHKEKVTELVWFGYSHNFKYVEPALEYLEERNIALTAYSDTKLVVPANLKNLGFNWLKYDYSKIHSDLIQYDGALLPDHADALDIRAQFKSNNKLTTCWALQLPVFTVPEDFERLASKEAREKEAIEKRRLVEQEYDVALSVEQYKELIKELQNER